MSMANDAEFQRAIQFVLKHECGVDKYGKLKDGYVNDPDDPGGETKFGISKRAYPGVNIRELTLLDALNIYYKDYWYVGKNEKFPMNLVVFDTAVNMGTKKAAQWLLATKGDWKAYLENRKQHYLAIVKSRPKSKKFLKGWMNRLNDLTKFIEIELTKG